MMKNRRFPCTLLLTLFLTLCLVCGGNLPLAAGPESGHPAAPAAEEEARPYQLLYQSLKESLAVEKQQLARIKQQLDEAREFEELCRERLDAYRIELNAHRNMLVLPTIPEYELQEARSQHLASLNKLSDRVRELEERLSGLQKLGESTRSKLSSYAEQKKEVEQDPEKSELVDDVEKKLSELIQNLSLQKEILESTESIYAGLLERTSRTRSEYKETASLFEQQIEQLAEKRILRRNLNPLSTAGLEQIREEADRIAAKLGSFFSFSYWGRIGVSDQKAYLLFVLTFFILFAALEAVLALCRRFISRLRDMCLEKGNFWQYLIFRLIRRSVFLVGAVFYIHFFPVKPAYQFTPLFMFLGILGRILVIVLIIRWGLNFLDVLWKESESAFRRFLNYYLKTMLYGIMAFGIFYYLIEAGVCRSCLLLVFVRLAFEIALFLWSLVFWHRFRFFSRESPLSESRWFMYAKPLLPAAGYAAVLPGIFFELLGYGAMAAFWYKSLGRTGVALLWAVVLYMALRESSAAAASAAEEEEPEPGAERPMPIRNLLIRLGKAGITVLAFMGVLFSWGARKGFLMGIFRVFNYQVGIGEVKISLLDIAVAVFIIFLTHTLVIVLKALLKEKILAHRDLEPGLKDSITTISGYIGWLIGIMIVFRVIGISVASLAVLFGALGIGIGFGLQNIFSNFISGIILLFERPIQVGDVIEINGIWGTVTRINVRATQVKTYDNADLIIPNSDFVSRQLTNWSFKDARVRRSITVGVAYGSDAELVKQTLTNIALNHPRVYRRPQPEVLFSDFGESALIFKLRVWAHINYFLSVETDIRFEINKKFKELGLQIPFPQRDIHFKGGSPSLPEASPAP